MVDDSRNEEGGTQGWKEEVVEVQCKVGNVRLLKWKGMAYM